jgi:hypothetical protein
MMYMFLRRNRQVDVPYIQRAASYLLHCSSSTRPIKRKSATTSTSTTINTHTEEETTTRTTTGSELLIPDKSVSRRSFIPASPSFYFFPEGTTLSTRNLERSNTFARSRGLPSWRYVLYPKAGGLSSLLSVLRPPRSLSRVPSSSSSP